MEAEYPAAVLAICTCWFALASIRERRHFWESRPSARRTGTGSARRQISRGPSREISSGSEAADQVLIFRYPLYIFIIKVWMSLAYSARAPVLLGSSSRARELVGYGIRLVSGPIADHSHAYWLFIFHARDH